MYPATPPSDNLLSENPVEERVADDDPGETAKMRNPRNSIVKEAFVRMFEKDPNIVRKLYGVDEGEECEILIDIEKMCPTPTGSQIYDAFIENDPNMDEIILSQARLNQQIERNRKRRAVKKTTESEQPSDAPGAKKIEDYQQKTAESNGNHGAVKRSSTEAPSLFDQNCAEKRQPTEMLNQPNQLETCMKRNFSSEPKTGNQVAISTGQNTVMGIQQPALTTQDTEGSTVNGGMEAELSAPTAQDGYAESENSPIDSVVTSDEEFVENTYMISDSSEDHAQVPNFPIPPLPNFSSSLSPEYNLERENYLLDRRPSPTLEEIRAFADGDDGERYSTSHEYSNQETGCGSSNRDNLHNIPLAEHHLYEPSEIEPAQSEAQNIAEHLSPTKTMQQAPITQDENVILGPENTIQPEPSQPVHAETLSTTGETLGTDVIVAEVEQSAEFEESLIDPIVTAEPKKMLRKCDLETPPRFSINPDEEPIEVASSVTNASTGSDTEPSVSRNTETASTVQSLLTEDHQPAVICPNENSTERFEGRPRGASEEPPPETTNLPQDPSSITHDESVNTVTSAGITSNYKKNRTGPMGLEQQNGSFPSQNGSFSTENSDHHSYKVEQQNRSFFDALKGMDDTYVGQTLLPSLSSSPSELQKSPTYVIADLDATTNLTSEDVLIESISSPHITKQSESFNQTNRVEYPSEDDLHESNVLNAARDCAEELVEGTSSELAGVPMAHHPSNSNPPQADAIGIPDRIYVAPKRRPTKAQRKRDPRLGSSPFGTRRVPSEPFNKCWISPTFVPDSTQLITVNQFDWRYPKNYEEIPSFFIECWPIAKPINNGMPDNTIGTNRNPMKCTIEVPPPPEPDHQTGRYRPILLHGIPWKRSDSSYMPYPSQLVLVTDSSCVNYQNLHKDNLTRLRMWLEWYPMYRPTKEKGFLNEVEEQTFTLLDGRYELYSKALIVGSRSSNDVDLRYLKHIYDLDAKCQAALKSLLPATIYINVKDYF